MENGQVVTLAKQINRVFQVQNKLVFISLIVLLGLLNQSCMSVSSMQTARVTPPKKFTVGKGLNMTHYRAFTEEKTRNVLGLMTETSLRYGIVDQVDIGLKLKIVGTSGGDIKYQYYGDANSLFAAAVALEMGYFIVSTRYTDPTTFEAAIPLHFSYHPSETFACYLTPKYVYRTYGNIESTSFYGFVCGFRFGKRFGLFTEYANLWNNSEVWSNQRQINVGFAKTIK